LATRLTPVVTFMFPYFYIYTDYNLCVYCAGCYIIYLFDPCTYLLVLRRKISRAKITCLIKERYFIIIMSSVNCRQDMFITLCKKKMILFTVTYVIVR